MKLREAFAWFVALFATVAFFLCDAGREAERDFLPRAVVIADQAIKVGGLYYGCGERANMIFECTEQICEVNGWEPPSDWYDRKDED